MQVLSLVGSQGDSPQPIITDYENKYGIYNITKRGLSQNLISKPVSQSVPMSASQTLRRHTPQEMVIKKD